MKASCTCSVCSCGNESSLHAHSVSDFYREKFVRLVTRRLTNAVGETAALSFYKGMGTDDKFWDDLLKEVQATVWNRDNSKWLAEEAVKAMKTAYGDSTRLIVARDAQGNLVGIANYYMDYRRFDPATITYIQDNIYVSYITTTGARFGTGTELMQKMAEEAYNVGKGMELYPLRDAITFYESLGLEEKGMHHVLSKEATEALAQMTTDEAKYTVITNAVENSPEISQASAKFAAEYEQYLSDQAVKEYIRGSVEALKDANYPIDWTLIQQAALDYGRTYKDLLVREGVTLINGKKVEWSISTLAKDTRADIADLIQVAIKEGKPWGVKESGKGTYPKGSLAADLDEYFDSVKSHASMVARTEGKRHQNQGRANSFYEMGVRSVIGRSFDCCDLCAEEIEGQEYNLGEEPDLPLHPNCKCYWEPVIESAYDEEGNPIDEDMFVEEESSVPLFTRMKNAVINLFRREEKNYGTPGRSGNWGHESREGIKGGSLPGGGLGELKGTTVVERERTRKDGTTYMAKVTVQADGSDLPAHIKSIPPNWRNATYSDDPDAALQVLARDDKGRRVAVYSQAAQDAEAAEKYARVDAITENFSDMKKENDLNIKNPETKENAECLQLIMNNGVRPGSDNDTKAAVKAFGATTLKGEHVVIEGDSVRLQFVGKKGVNIDIEITDPDTKRMLMSRKEAAGNDGNLFNTDASKLSAYSHSLNKEAGFLTKDFRTHLGTSTAKDLISKMPKPRNKTEYKKMMNEVAKQVSAKLGNKPAQALKSYIDPRVFTEWQKVL